jgi:hypothetical protein
MFWSAVTVERAIEPIVKKVLENFILDNRKAFEKQTSMK